MRTDHRLRERTVIDVQEERRRNAKALAIVALVLIILGAFAYRPATLIGVHGDALAHSVGGGDLLGTSKCEKVGDDVWRCDILWGQPNHRVHR